jgi:hypothetical protein
MNRGVAAAREYGASEEAALAARSRRLSAQELNPPVATLFINARDDACYFRYRKPGFRF